MEELSPDDDASDNDFRPPPPMEDRLWRHPSELGLYATAGPRVILRNKPSKTRTLVAAALGLVLGSAAGAGALVASGIAGNENQQAAPERIAAPAPRSEGRAGLASAEKALPSIARLEVGRPTGPVVGSAVVVNDDGLLVTTSDVVDGAGDITVVLDDGTTHTASLVGRDRRNDIGVLTIDAPDLTPVDVPASPTVTSVGFGDPILVVDVAGPSQSAVIAGGLVTRASTTAAANSIGGNTQPELQTDPQPATQTDPQSQIPAEVPAEAQPEAGTAAGPDDTELFGMVELVLAPGSPVPAPGSVVVDEQGAFVGVVTGRHTPTSATDPQATHTVFAVPHDHIQRVYEQFATEGRYTPADLDLDVADTGDRTDTSDNPGDATGSPQPPEDTPLRNPADGTAPTGDTTIGGTGVVVRSQPADGPVAAAGIQAGDVITAINGEPVTSVNDHRTAIRRFSEGDTVEVTIVRNGEVTTTELLLGGVGRVP